MPTTKRAKVLIVVTSHATVGGTGKPTGVWIEELTTPYYVFLDAGAAVDIVSITGGKVPIDPQSLEADRDKNPESVRRFLNDPAAIAKTENSKSIADVSADAYDAIFLPGGHGTMWDLPNSTTLSTQLSDAWAKGKILSAVCHGPVGLLNVTDTDGKPVIAGRRVAAFSNSEEKAAGLDHTVPFLLESRIRELGGLYDCGPDFQAFTQQDGRLITGQNPASSEGVARLVLAAANIGP